MVIKINYTSSDVYVSTSVSPVYVVVNYSAVNNAGGVAWGAITGTLSDQTDLQTALDAKFDDPTGTTSQYLRGDGTLATFPTLTGYVPYAGATTNVDLGEYELKAGQLTLDVSPTGTASVGTTRWNDTIGSSETTLKGGNVILKNGVDLVARVVNKVTPNTTLTKAAYQAVKVSGAQGQRLAVSLAQANNDANSADTIGLVTETIATNQEGFIMTVGNLENINTTGSLQGETWADGDVLYLSPTTAGALTNVKPNGSTGHIVVVGYVEYAHQNNGKIYVKIMNGWELDELHNVYISSVANNDALIYESSTSLWKNKTIATALGYTPVPTTRTLTINGTAYDLSADRSWTVSGSATPAGSNTQIQYNNSGVFGASAGLTYNDSTGVITLNKNQNAPTSLLIKNLTGGTNAYSQIELTADVGYFGMFKISSAYNTYKIIQPSDAGYYNSNAGGDFSFLNDSSTGKFKWAMGGAGTAQMTLTAAGRLLLGTTTEATYIFDAVGNTRVSGDLTITNSSSNAFIYLNTGTTTTASIITFTSSGNVTNGQLLSTAPSFSYGTLLAKETSLLGNGVVSLRSNDTGYIRFMTGNADPAFSTEKARITSAGRLLLGTTTEGTYLLDVNGTARVSGQVTVSVSSANPLVLNRGLTSTAAIYLDGAVNACAYGNGTDVGGAGSEFLYLSKTLNSVSLYVNSTQQFRIFSTGNLVLQNGGTFTDAGYRLDVNGTARVSGGDQYYGFNINNTTNRQVSLQFAISGSTKWQFGSDFAANGTKDFYIYDNTNARSPLYVNTSGDVLLGGTSGYFNTENVRLYFNGIALFRKTGSTTYDTYIGDGTYNNTINFQYNTNASSGGTINYAGYLGGTTQFRDLFIADGKNNYIAKFEGSTKSLNVGDGTTNASSVLSANSTTRGFLPPRGTNTQMLAIASPAAGLMFYDTTNNKLNCYDGTTWQACW